MEPQADVPFDPVVLLLQCLPANERVRLSRVCTAWHMAAVATLTEINAKVDEATAVSLSKWLKSHGGQVEVLNIKSCEPSSLPKWATQILKDPVDEVFVQLPCASLPKLRRLDLSYIDILLEGFSDSSTHNPLPSLTSLRTSQSPNIVYNICIYIHSLSSLKQLSMGDMDYPTGNLMRMATTLTQLTRLRLLWTGDPAWEYKAQVYPHGFSRNGRYYEPNTTYYDDFGNEAPMAFTEDITFLFSGLPSLLDLELGIHTDLVGDEALSRNFVCKSVAAATPRPAASTPAGAGAAASTAAAPTNSLGSATSGSEAGASSAAAVTRAGLKSLNICQPLDVQGIRNMLAYSLTTLTRLEFHMAIGRSLDDNESNMFTLSLLQMRHQLAHLVIGQGVIAETTPASHFRRFSALSACTQLRLCSDACPAGAMSEMFAGGPGSCAKLRVLRCSFTQTLYGTAAPRGVYDLKAMVAACPNLEDLELNGACFEQGSSDSASAECRALRSLTRLTSLKLYNLQALQDSMFEDFAEMKQLQRLSIRELQLFDQALHSLSWPRLAKLTSLTRLQELDASPLIAVTPERPWSYPAAAAPAGPATAQGPSCAGAGIGTRGNSGTQPAAPTYMPDGVALHQLLAEVAANAQLQSHAAKLVSSPAAWRAPSKSQDEDDDW